ncbi:U3 small nucleolar RNA-associated protein 6-domain-containing protein [Umbelopsis sp. PMI_123]|nr:U3 small nucleolar RNA-associated protein 6-domain-containing protein [Umbelopsis sp. PMI_123]
MADTVQFYLEQMVPELEDLENKNLFSKTEIKAIVKKRTNFEYALKRRISKKVDYLRYIEYEMNLEALRKKRKSRLESQPSKQSLSDYAGTRRIFFIFERALRKFNGDISLWLQYIEFAKANGANKTLGKIFADAIQLHPTKPALWIMAASWEFEENANIVAARVLMQRGLRLNPGQAQLWHEYFRLEQLYIEKIKARRKILGIDQNQQGLKELEDTEDSENSAEMIKLPTVSAGEFDDMDEDGQEVRAVKQMEESVAEKMREGINPILNGLLSTIVYDNAINAIPDDLDFRTKFAEIYNDFSGPEVGIEHVYETIRRDFSENEEARAYLASRPLYVKSVNGGQAALKINDPKFVQAIRQCVQEFDSCVEDIPTTKMWELYTRFLSEWGETVTEPNLKTYFTKLLLRTLKTVEKKHLISASMYILWIQISCSQDETDKALAIAEKACEAFPTSVDVWLKRIELVDNTQTQSESVMAEDQLFQTALNKNGASFKLWSAYVDWIEKKWQNDALKPDTVDELLTTACRKATTLLPSVVESTAERDAIKDYVLGSYVVLTARIAGIKKARDTYKRLINSSFPTLAFYKACLQIEGEYGKGKTSVSQSQYLYEMALRLNDDKEDTYLAYIAYLNSQKLFSKAMAIYAKAQQEVRNRELFEQEYQKYKDGKSSEKRPVLGETSNNDSDTDMITTTSD